MSPNPSPRIGDWSAHRETAQLIVTNTSGASKQVKLSTQISLDGSLVANTKNQSMPVLTIPPGAATFDAGALIPYNDVNFQGQIDQSVKRSGLLPEGQYQICVSLIDPSTYQQITQPVCQSFTIIGYQQPILLKPEDNSVVDASNSAPPPIFMWTSVTPAPPTLVTYHFKIIELMPGQQPRAAFQSNPPLFQRDIMSATQFVYTPDASPLRDSMFYVWSVQATDQAGNVLGQGDGWAVPFSFMAITSGQPKIIDNEKLGLRFTPDGLGIIMGSPEYLNGIIGSREYFGGGSTGGDVMTEKITIHHEGLYVGDVAFEEGDPDRPFIIGMQFKGEDGQKHNVNVAMPSGVVFDVNNQPTDASMHHALGQKEWGDVLTNEAAQKFEDIVLRGLDKSHRLQRGEHGSAYVTDTSTGGDGGGSVEKGDNGVNPDGAAKGQASEGMFNPKEYGIGKSVYFQVGDKPTEDQMTVGDLDGDGFPDVAIGDMNGDGAPDVAYYRKYKGKMGNAQSNPMYEDNRTGGTNPLYEEQGKDLLASPVIVSSGDGGIVGGFQSSTFELKTNDATGHYLRKKLPGKMKSGQITLTRGISTSTNLYQWLSEVSSGQNIRKNITITMLSKDGKDGTRYTLYDCVPTGVDGTEQVIDPSDSAGKMEVHSFSWGALSDQQGGNNKGNSGLTADTHPCDTCPIDLMSFSWGAVALSFDSADVDSVPANNISDLSNYLSDISGDLGHATGEVDLSKGRMTLLEPITIPGTGDAVLLITGAVSSTDEAPKETISQEKFLRTKGFTVNIAGNTGSRIKVKFPWLSGDAVVRGLDKSHRLSNGTTDVRGWDPENKQGAVQYRETSFEFVADNASTDQYLENGRFKVNFDAFYALPQNMLMGMMGGGSSSSSSQRAQPYLFTPVVTDGGGHGRLFPAPSSPFTFTCGTGMSKPMYTWIKSSFDKNYMRKNGAIIAADYNRNGKNSNDSKEDKGTQHTGNMSGNHKDIMELAFTNALITEVGFPALDASSKDAAKMSIKFTPETTRFDKSSDTGNINGNYKIDKGVQKKWLPSNFRIKIDGLDDACTKVSKIEAITIKQKNVENAVGEMRGYEKEPANIEMPNLVFTIPESDAKPFQDWYQSELMTRKAGGTQQEDAMLTTRKAGEKPRDGALEYLSGDGSVLYTLNLQGITPVNMEQEGTGSGAQEKTMHWVLTVRVQRIEMQ